MITRVINKAGLQLKYSVQNITCSCGFLESTNDITIQCNQCSRIYHKKCVCPRPEEDDAFWCENCIQHQIDMTEVDFHAVDTDSRDVNTLVTLFEDSEVGLSWSDHIPEWEADETWESLTSEQNRFHRREDGNWWVEYNSPPPPNTPVVGMTPTRDDNVLPLDEEVSGITHFLAGFTGTQITVLVYNSLLLKILTKGWINRWRYNLGRNSKNRIPVVWKELLELTDTIDSKAVTVFWRKNPGGNNDVQSPYEYHNPFPTRWKLFAGSREMDPEKVEQVIMDSKTSSDVNNWHGSSSTTIKLVKSEGLSQLSNRYMFDYAIGASERRAHMLARINAWPTKHRLWIENMADDQNCPFCGEVETVCHIMSICTAYKNIRMKKHDELSNTILSHLLAESSTDLQAAMEIFWGEMLSVKFVEAPFKPDIVIFLDCKWVDFVQRSTGMHPDSLRKCNRIQYKLLWEQWRHSHTPTGELVIIIEVAAPWDSKLDDRLAEKSDKYTEVTNTLIQLGYKAKLICIGIGALGTITPKAAQAIRSLGLSTKGCRSLMAKMSRIVCIFSGRFYALRWCKNIQEQEIANNYPAEII